MKTCIIVLGMHRSGTSALTGTLEKIGIMLPQDLWPAQEDNPKGFFEGRRVIDINERLLASNGSNYDDTRFDTKISEESIAQHLDETKKFLQEEFSYSKCFALKDPRMCITFPLWERALLELEIDIKVVIPYRNPFEVARSLKKRNNFSTEKSLLLWAKHILLAEKYSRKYKRHFISFNSLMNNTADSLPELAKFAGVELSQSAVTTVQEQFLDPTLKHHNLDMNNVAENIPDFIRKLILFTQKQRFANVTKKEWNTIFNEVTALYQFFHTYDVQFQSQISRDLHAQRDQASDQAQSFKEQLAQQAELNQSHIVALELEKDELLKRQSQLEQEAEQLLQDLDSIKEAKQAQKTEQQSQIDCLSAEKSALYEETQRLVQQLKEQEQTADQTLQDREQQLRAVQEQNEVQIEILKQKNDQLLERQNQLEQEAEQLLQDLDSIKEAKQTQKDELQSHIDRLSKEKAALHEKSHKQEQQLMEQARVSEQALQEKDQKLSDLEQSYTQQIKQSQAKINALELENSELLKRKDELSQEVSSLTESIDTVVQDLDILKKQKKSFSIYSILGFSKALKSK
ncbi:sulfotransferase domain-containing protein [Oceanimonas smirnovii]|uniref:sulfotransferase domain-containing protein n=1 Tax=Oceanimonas smirnovii TaxID=264574 RepID=UPI003FD61E34